MEPFENNDFRPEAEPQSPVPEAPAAQPEAAYTPPHQEPQQGYGAYHGTGAGRKESPYENSPYVRQQPYQEYQYQPQTQPPQKPPKPKKEKKARKGIWKGILSAILILALVAGGCGATAYFVNEY